MCIINYLYILLLIYSFFGMAYASFIVACLMGPVYLFKCIYW